MSFFLESAGISTTGISLVRPNTEQMALPRFLWVPFELGRPFGSPNQPDFQRRVLREALLLLERADGPVVLEDFPDDAPASETSDENWSCPVSFRPAREQHTGLAAETAAEIERLAPWQELYVSRGHAPSAANCPIERGAFLMLLGRIVSGEGVDEVAGLPLPEWLRLGCDDLRAFYFEAARGRPGNPSSQELRDWFWRDTAAGRLQAAVARCLLQHESPVVRIMALRGIVPREYFPELLPNIDPFV